MVVKAGKKRASPGAEEEKNLFEPEISDETAKKLDEISKDILRVELANDRANHKRLAPVFEKRRELLKSIPKFWPVALMNNSTVGVHVQHAEDQKAILALTDVWVERDPVESRTFTIEFHFAENPYFSDSVLKKEYKFTPPPAAKDETPDEHGITDSMLDFDWERDVDPQAIKINWKSDTVNLTKLHPRVTESDGDVSDPGSFFNFFEAKDDPFDIGLVIANDIYPEAVDWFTGKAAEADLDISDEEDSEDDEEDDDDAEEIDLEKPEPKKQRRN